MNHNEIQPGGVYLVRFSHGVTAKALLTGVAQEPKANGSNRTPKNAVWNARLAEKVGSFRKGHAFTVTSRSVRSLVRAPEPESPPFRPPWEQDEEDADNTPANAPVSPPERGGVQAEGYGPPKESARPERDSEKPEVALVTLSLEVPILDMVDLLEVLKDYRPLLRKVESI